MDKYISTVTMKKILVSGLINLETTLRVDSFPVTYEPVRFPFWGVRSTISGVGYNLAKALTALGNELSFMSMVGEGVVGKIVLQALQDDHISREFVMTRLAQTPQSVILYNQTGQRQIHVDLKDVQERPFPPDLFHQALSDCDLALLCNINFNRPFLRQAKQAGKQIATDVHTIADLDDSYNADFMAAADILFMSDEKLPTSPESWVRHIQNKYGTPIVVIGLGASGALLAVKDDHFCERVSAVKTRAIVNTIGAGDALFSSFNHFYHKTDNPYLAIKKAIYFASYKIGEAGAAQGFLSESTLEELML